MNAPTREEIERATAEYLERGGHITRLPGESRTRRGGWSVNVTAEHGNLEDSAGSTLEGMGAYDRDPRSGGKKPKRRRSTHSKMWAMREQADDIAGRMRAEGAGRRDIVLAIFDQVPRVSQYTIADALGTINREGIRQILKKAGRI